MRASFDEVSSRRLYNIASLGGTADQLKMKFRTFLFTNHYTYSLPKVPEVPYMYIMMGRLRNLNRYSSLTVHDGAVTGSSRLGTWSS